MKENDTEKEISRQKWMVSDYDSGLLQDSFAPITGTPEEKYDDRCDRLERVASRLKRWKYKKKIENNEELDKVLLDIDSFLDKDLAGIIPVVSDYKQKEGRIITVKREDSSAEPTCVAENLTETAELIREEQYFKKNNQIRKLGIRAKAFLDDDIFFWHRDDRIGEIDPSEKLEEMRKNGQADE